MNPEDGTEAFTVSELMDLYAPVKEQIEDRLEEFRQIWAGASEEELFRELVFCLLTPQSRARTCWKAVQRLIRKCMIAEGEPAQIQEELVGVRFNQPKGGVHLPGQEYVRAEAVAVHLSEFASPFAAREWLVQNVLGLGYKEASHFLRNIGLGRGAGHSRPSYPQESVSSGGDRCRAQFALQEDLPGDRAKDDRLL